MSISPLIYVGYADGASYSSRNIASTTWVLFLLIGELVSLWHIFLGPMTKKVAKYNVVIELLVDSIALGVFELMVNKDSQLMVSQLNHIYHAIHLLLFHQYIKVCILECSFECIRSQHVPRSSNTLDDLLDKFLL